MRYSKDHKAQTQRRIVESASQLLRANGVEAVGVASLMQSLGLTHGGFYGHFESKEGLVAAAADAALNESSARLRAVADAAPAGSKLRHVWSTYVSIMHRDAPERGCLFAALGTEIARQPPEIRDLALQQLNRFLGFIEELARLDGLDVSAPAVLSLMVGSVVLARVSKDGNLSERFIVDALASLPKLTSKPTPAKAPARSPRRRRAR